MENNRAGVDSKDSLGVLPGKVVPDPDGDAGEWWDVAQWVQIPCLAAEAELLKRNIQHSGVEK